VRASSITSDTFGKVAHPLPGISMETDRKRNRSALMIVIVHSTGSRKSHGRKTLRRYRKETL
jgi:hypothetical protein